MAKFSLPKSGGNVTRSSLRVPSAMLAQMDSAMLKAGFNRKQRSKWVEDITWRFLLRSDAGNLIAEEFIVPGTTESIPVTISNDLYNHIEQVVEQVRIDEGVSSDRSSVIRTAIIQELLARRGMQLSPQETAAQGRMPVSPEETSKQKGLQLSPQETASHTLESLGGIDEPGAR